MSALKLGNGVGMGNPCGLWVYLVGVGVGMVGTYGYLRISGFHFTIKFKAFVTIKF